LNVSSGVPAQDFHMIFSKILEEFIGIQEEGFEWDLTYRGRSTKALNLHHMYTSSSATRRRQTIWLESTRHEA
jgi:hypothetical protein